jgi:hypothetical protein
MNLLTLDQIKTKLKYDTDIFDGDFIELDTELLGYINEAIDDAEALIHNLYEDYFLTSSTISLVSGTSEYSLPTDIFGAKLRAVHYSNGTKKYELKRIKRLSDTLFLTDATDDYQYVLVNAANTAATGSFKLKIYPQPSESVTNGITLWYIRNAKRLSAASDYCDIPEFINFIFAHVRWNIARKEKGRIDLSVVDAQLKQQKELLEATLSDMAPTEDSNEIRADLSFYSEFDSMEVY